MKKATTTTETNAKVEITNDERMRFILQMYVQREEERVESMKQEFMKNFCYEMAWNAEDLYTKIYILDHYKSMLVDMQTYTPTEVISEWIDRSKTYVSRSYNVREKSTGTMHREVSTWKYVANMEMVEYLTSIQK